VNELKAVQSLTTTSTITVHVTSRHASVA